MRAIPVLLVTVGLMASLTACASDPSYSACGQYESGDSSSLVDVTGSFGVQPSIKFPTPVATSTTQASELIQGEGNRLVVGQPALVELSIYNGTTGDEIQSTPFDGTGVITMVGESPLTAVGHALECAAVGSRLVIAASAQDAHKGEAIEQLNVQADDPFVFVVDVIDAFLAKAEGAAQSPQPGHPAIVTAPNGTPGITIPSSGGAPAQPPTDLQTSVLTRGDGDKIEAGSYAVLQYTGVLWSTNKVFDSTWQDGQAAVLPMTEKGVIPGFLDGIVGQTVGSRVLLVVPPEFGYGDAGSGSIPSGSTLVFVVDILGQLPSV